MGNMDADANGDVGICYIDREYSYGGRKCNLGVILWFYDRSDCPLPQAVNHTCDNTDRDRISSGEIA